MIQFIYQQIANFYILRLKTISDDKKWNNTYQEALEFNALCVEMDLYLD